MALWVPIFVVGLVLGSWLMVRPSKLERHLGRLRMSASGQGFRVMLPQVAASMHKELHGIPQGAVLYYRGWSEAKRLHIETTLVDQDSVRPEELGSGQNLSVDMLFATQEFVRNDPLGVDAVLLEKSMMGFFWSESGSIQALSATLIKFADLQKFIEEQL